MTEHQEIPSSPRNELELLTEKQLSQHLKICRRQLYTWRMNGLIPYRHTLENLGTEPGLVGIIFRKAQNKISNPSDLQNLSFSRKSLFSRLGKLDKLREIS